MPAKLTGLLTPAKLQPLFWVMYFIVSFRLFARFPAGNVDEILLLLTLLILLIFCGYEFITQLYHGKLNRILFILLPLIVLPVLNAWQAERVFGQPMIYGILAQRQSYLILGAWFIVIALRRNLVPLRKIESYFILAMYVMLAIMYFFYLFIDPNKFAETEFVVYSFSKGWVYKFPNGVTAGLLIFSFVKIILQDKTRYLVPFLICIWYFIYYGQDRSQLVFIVVTLLFLYINTVSLRRKFFYGFTSLVFIAFAAVAIALFNPDLYSRYIELYTNASSIFTKNSSTESSTNIRFVEAVIATKGFNEHPVLGNGVLSNQWYDGYFRYYKYFYPSDVGILGNLYVFGMVGTLFFYIPYMFVLAWAIQLRKIKDALYLTGVYGSLFLFFDMFTAASNLTFIGLPAFFFGIVYYYRYHVYPPRELSSQSTL
jgi:hypothetical protein